jgi:hypothetical protein
MKNKKPKQYIVTIHEQHGEYEHKTKCLFRTASDPIKYADNMAKTWYGDEEPEQADDGYWQNGEIISSAGEVKEIPASDFAILKKYLSVL